MCERWAASKIAHLPSRIVSWNSFKGGRSKGTFHGGIPHPPAFFLPSRFYFFFPSWRPPQYASEGQYHNRLLLFVVFWNAYTWIHDFYFSSASVLTSSWIYRPTFITGSASGVPACRLALLSSVQCRLRNSNGPFQWLLGAIHTPT